MQAQHTDATAFATESRALSAHAAVLLRGFGIPSVGSVAGLAETVQDDDQVVVDALNGLVIVRPLPDTLRTYRAVKKETERPAVERSR